MIKLILKNINKKNVITFIIIAMLVVLQVWLELKMPDFMSEITRLVEIKDSNMSDILKNGGYMLLCALGSLVAAVFTGYLVAWLTATITKRIRKELFTKVEDLAINEIKQFSTSSLLTRTTNDISQIQMTLAMGTQLIIKAPITAIWAVFKILNKSWQWSSLTGVEVAIMLSLISVIIAIVSPRFKIVQKLTDKLNTVSRENLTGIRVVRAFNAEKYQENKFNNVNSNLTNMQMFNQNAFALLEPLIYLLMDFLPLGIYIIGANLINDADMTSKIELFGNMIVFSSYAMQIIISILLLAMIFMMLPRAQVSADRINEVLDTPNTIKDGKKKNIKTDVTGKVEFKNVTFQYPDANEPLLKDISFVANKGETVAFIGSTGCGKSTLINLIPRLYDATNGEVLVDDINVKDFTQEELHDKLGYVPQRAVIFSDTVKNNVTFGDNGKGEISDEKVNEAIKVAQAEEFVSKMENGTDTVMSRGGTNVSGGQKQRLSIARAIARDPEIYIFDDTFSALDYKTDSILRKELKKHTKDATVLIVAQRIGTVMNADKIIVLEDGKIVGMGKHEELLQNCEVYKQIALSQLSKEELENG